MLEVDYYFVTFVVVSFVLACAVGVLCLLLESSIRGKGCMFPHEAAENAKLESQKENGAIIQEMFEKVYTAKPHYKWSWKLNKAVRL